MAENFIDRCTCTVKICFIEFHFDQCVATHNVRVATSTCSLHVLRFFPRLIKLYKNAQARTLVTEMLATRTFVDQNTTCSNSRVT